MQHESTEATERALVVISAYIVEAYRLGVSAARNSAPRSPSSLRCDTLDGLKKAARSQGASSSLVEEAWRSGVIAVEKHG